MTADHEELKRRFIAARGYWAEFWDGLLALDPEFFEAYLEFSTVPWKKGRIEAKVKEFIYVAINASTTHLHEPGLRTHLRNAFKHGATKEEIMEIFELVSMLGMHTVSMGVPILLDELAAAGQCVDMQVAPQQEELKRRFIEKRGWWAEVLDGVLALDPEFFEAYLQFSTVPWKRGHIEPKVKEFIYIAVNASTTHLHEPGLRIHLRNALGHGATKEEIMEIYELVSVLGMHTVSVGVPILLDEMAKAGTDLP